ncbi:MAG: VOC family protein [Planctomycetaceae bacterium]|nr:VOC family protein [Planctomycetaceae bacterium]
MSDSVTTRLEMLQAPVCCSAEPEFHGTRFHVALNASDLGRSVQFYRILFGTRPARQHDDYAKFELTRPPLILSLIPHSPGRGDNSRYFAFPVHHPAEVEAVGTRLEVAGLHVDWKRDEPFDDARQHAAVVNDPDGNCWRIACRLGNLESLDSGGRSVSIREPDQSPADASIGWEHRIVSPCPSRIPHADNSVDFVRLEGTFNADLTGEQRFNLLTEAMRVLKAGGVVHIHGLVANRELPGCPALPGVAALVRHVPTEREILSELWRAGLRDLRMTKLPAKAAFRWGEVELRELKLSAWKPMEPGSEKRLILYRGPFARLTMDDGRSFERGVPTLVDLTTAARLRSEPWEGQFLALWEAEADNDTPDCATRSASRRTVEEHA